MYNYHYYLMKNIIKFIQKYIPTNGSLPLGRWNIDYCNKKMNTKIDLSNEDHCGPCGQYALSKTTLKNNKVNVTTSSHDVKK